METSVLIKAFENGGYFVILVLVLYAFYKVFYNLGLKALTKYLEYEEQKTKSFIETNAKIVESLNEHRKINSETHQIIINKIENTHKDVKAIKEKIL